MKRTWRTKTLGELEKLRVKQRVSERRDRLRSSRDTGFHTPPNNYRIQGNRAEVVHEPQGLLHRRLFVPENLRQNMAVGVDAVSPTQRTSTPEGWAITRRGRIRTAPDQLT